MSRNLTESERFQIVTSAVNLTGARGQRDAKQYEGDLREAVAFLNAQLREESPTMRYLTDLEEAIKYSAVIVGAYKELRTGRCIVAMVSFNKAEDEWKPEDIRTDIVSGNADALRLAQTAQSLATPGPDGRRSAALVYKKMEEIKSGPNKGKKVRVLLRLDPLGPGRDDIPEEVIAQAQAQAQAIANRT